MCTAMKEEPKRLKKRFPALKKHYGKRIYMEDEMRSGTPTACKQRWTPKDHRPVCNVKLGYPFVYWYAAIAPASGTLLALLLPERTKASFCLFGKHFKKQTNQLHRNHKVVLVADGAGAHQPSVCEQWGIAFEKRPAACPELNPVERFFEELRQELANCLFDTIRQLENFLCKILSRYFNHPQSLVQLGPYPYIRNT